MTMRGITYVIVLISTCVLSISSGIAQNTAPSQAAKVSLSGFVNNALASMGLPEGTKIPGLSNADDLQLENVTQVSSNVTTAKVSIRKIPFDITSYKPTGKTSELIVIGADGLELHKIIPGLDGTPLGALGKMESAAFVYVPK